MQRQTDCVPACIAAPPPQESKSLQAKQRQLQTALASSQKELRAAAGRQEQAAALAAELEAAQAAAAAATQELALAHGRCSVLERAHAAAFEVRLPAWGAGAAALA